MNVVWHSTRRDVLPDLLTRPPSGVHDVVATWSHLFVDPVRQLEVLAELFDSGLLSREEFERYKGHVQVL